MGGSWRAISISDSKPASVTSSVLAPRRSSRALVATVVPWSRSARASAPHRGAGPGHHPLALVVGGGRDLPDGHGRTVPHGDVGERPAHVDAQGHPSGTAPVVALGHGAGASVLRSVMGLVRLSLRSVMGLVRPVVALGHGAGAPVVALGHGAGASVLRSVMGLVRLSLRSVMGLVRPCCARSWGWCVRVALGHGAGAPVVALGHGAGASVLRSVMGLVRARLWRPCRCGQRNLLRRAGRWSRSACRGRLGP